MAFSCGRVWTLLNCDHVVYPADDFETRHIRYHNRDAFLAGLSQGVGSRVATLNQDDSRVVLQAGYGNDILMNLPGDPEITFFAVGHDIAQQVADVAPQNLGSEPFLAGDDP